MARRASTTTGPLSLSTRVAVLHGKDSYRRSEYTSMLRRVLEAEHPGLDVLGFDGQSASAAEVLDECRSQGLMAGHKLVVVDNADAFVREETRPLLERYCAGPSDSATLLLRAERWYKGKLDDAIARVGAVLKCDARAPAEAAAWVVEHARDAHGATIDTATARRLVDRVGTDGGRLAGEVGKLSVAAGSGAIVAALVEQLVGDTREDEAWAFQDVLLGAQPEPILASLRRLLDNAPRETAVLVTIVMIDLARKLHAMGAALAAGESARTAAGRLKIWPFERAGALAERAGRASPARLRALYHAAIEADVRQKSGLGKPSRTLERLALRFTSL